MAQLYLKFEGGGADLDGTVKRPKYDKCIEIEGFGLGATHEGGRPTVAQKGKSVKGNAAPGDLGLTKVAGPESPGLFQACLKGTVIDKAILTMDGSSDDKVAEPIFTIELEAVAIKHVDWGGGSGGGEGSIGESVSLSYDKMTMTHVETSKIMNYSASQSAQA